MGLRTPSTVAAHVPSLHGLHCREAAAPDTDVRGQRFKTRGPYFRDIDESKGSCLSGLEEGAPPYQTTELWVELHWHTAVRTFTSQRAELAFTKQVSQTCTNKMFKNYKKGVNFY